MFRITDSITLESGITVPCITGQCSQVEVVSQNGYRYRKGFWDKVMAEQAVVDSINSRDNFGMVEHPVDDDDFIKTPYAKASHIILKAWVQDGNPFATIGLLNNDNGNQIKALVDVGHKPGISTRGLGSFDKDSVSQFVSEKEYMFITWDIVRSPNFADLKMDKVTDSLMRSPVFKELCEMHHLKDSVDEHYSKSKLDKCMDTAIQALIDLKNELKSI